MDPITRQTALGAAGAGGDPVYVDDVFSTYLYDGNEGSNQINNGIDLAGEGGLVWFKNRTRSGDAPTLIDTETQSGGYLISSGTAALSGTQPFSSFNSNGYTINSGSFYVNDSSHKYASWTFRKAPGFFDVVTYTGNGTAGRTVAHSLGSVPGMIIIKATSKTSLWRCYHRSLPSANYVINLNQTAAATDSGAAFWNSTAPTASVFTLGDTGNVNETGSTYVAYIFAHDAAQFGTDLDESIIKCGSVTTDGSENGIVDLGFEPQFVMFKRSDSSGSWLMLDTMRGWDNSNDDKRLYADVDNAESTTSAGHGEVNSTGFRIYNMGANADVIYMAIRRPHKPPTAATEVFSVDDQSSGSGSGGASFSAPSFPIDLMIAKGFNTNADWKLLDRIRGYDKALISNDNSLESTENYLTGFDQMEGYTVGSNGGVLNNSDSITWCFKRAPGFFDIVGYNGSGSATTQNHNLEAVPELMIIKRRNSSGNWVVYAEGIGASPAASYYLYLHDLGNRGSSGNYFNDTAPTSSVFTIGGSNDVNNSSSTYLAYLFATLPGISKVGNYTSDGNARDVDCGFTGGARFVLIKKTNGNGNWYLFDTTRGITSGNDPYMYLNDTMVQQTTDDYIDPLNAGFALPASTPVNTNGSTYIFLAIA